MHSRNYIPDRPAGWSDFQRSRLVQLLKSLKQHQHLLRRSRRLSTVDSMVESSDEFFMALSLVELSHPIPTYSDDSRDCGKCWQRPGVDTLCMCEALNVSCCK